MMLTDKYGHVAETYQYDVWGKAYDGRFKDGFPGWSGRNDNVYGFTGQRYQPELGVYSFAYRDYSPRTMRWLTVDPVKDGGNWYHYCDSDPINIIDIDGLKTYDLGKGWTIRVENPHVPTDQRHIHVEYKGEEVWNQNEDGTVHHKNKVKDAQLPQNVKDKVKDKTGWDTDNPPKAEEKEKKDQEMKENVQKATVITVVIAIAKAIAKVLMFFKTGSTCPG